MRRVAQVLGKVALSAAPAPLAPANRAAVAVLPVRLVSLHTWLDIPPR